jgi:1-acyl-sn-glycerol-3-phosphate acyltransferase
MEQTAIESQKNQKLISDSPSPVLLKALKGILKPLFKVLWRIEYHNMENIPQDMPGGLIVASNHQTYLDPFWLGVVIKRQLRFLAWDKACHWFIIGPLIRKLGAFPVNLERGGKESIKTAIRVLKEGSTLVVFPEGSREYSDGKLLELKPGTVRIALEAGVNILPVTIRGGNKVWSREDSFPGFRKVKIYYHPMLEVKLPENINARTYAGQLTKKLAEIIDSIPS